MILVADTGPINYLIQIGYINVLPRMWGTLVIPSVVRDELSAAGAPAPVRTWISSLPSWVEIHGPATLADPQLDRLDPGERHAILLAMEIRPDGLLMDEMAGRREALRRGLAVIGTLGVLYEAARLRHLDFHEALARLRATNFRASQSLIRSLVERYEQWERSMRE